MAVGSSAKTGRSEISARATPILRRCPPDRFSPLLAFTRVQPAWRCRPAARHASAADDNFVEPCSVLGSRKRTASVPAGTGMSVDIDSAASAGSGRRVPFLSRCHKAGAAASISEPLSLTDCHDPPLVWRKPPVEGEGHRLLQPGRCGQEAIHRKGCGIALRLGVIEFRIAAEGREEFGASNEDEKRLCYSACRRSPTISLRCPRPRKTARMAIESDEKKRWRWH